MGSLPNEQSKTDNEDSSIPLYLDSLVVSVSGVMVVSAATDGRLVDAVVYLTLALVAAAIAVRVYGGERLGIATTRLVTASYLGVGAVAIIHPAISLPLAALSLALGVLMGAFGDHLHRTQGGEQDAV